MRLPVIESARKHYTLNVIVLALRLAPAPFLRVCVCARVFMCSVSNAQILCAFAHTAMNFQLWWWWWSSLSSPSSTWQLKTVPMPIACVCAWVSVFAYSSALHEEEEDCIELCARTPFGVVSHINCLWNKFFSVISGGNEVGKRKNVFVFLIIHTPYHTKPWHTVVIVVAVVRSFVQFVDCFDTEVCGVCVCVYAIRTTISCDTFFSCSPASKWICISIRCVSVAWQWCWKYQHEAMNTCMRYVYDWNQPNMVI